MIYKLLEPTDFVQYHDFFHTLSNLRPSPEIPVPRAQDILQKIQQHDGHVFIAVDKQSIVGTTTLLIEQKFLRDGSLCGHIEDVVTHPQYLTRGIASRLMDMAVEYAQSRKCYKVVLYCEQKLESFYKRIGFHTKGLHMEYRFSTTK